MNNTDNMLEKDLKTFFASPERADRKELQDQFNSIINDPIVKIILQAVKGYAMILNEHRQILAGNQELLNALGLRENDLIGERPGELLHCEHSETAPSGCGTGYNCQSCGAALAIVAAQEYNKVCNQECRLLMSHEGEMKCFDFQVQATPFLCGNKKLLIFVLQDISNAKRKEVLEKVFFHDINNTLGALTGYCSLLQLEDDSLMANKILSIADRLKDEISFQEVLILAEKGTLPVKLKDASISNIIEKLKIVFKEHKAAQDRSIDFQPLAGEVFLKTDIILLYKVLVNMLKNALEATQKGGQVKFFCEILPASVRFCVHNSGFIPEIVALNIFHRSFSTKPGTGRGVGTYSMKLFGENYLKGKVGFTTHETQGTVFSIELPYSI